MRKLMLISSLAVLPLAGCGRDCSEAAHMGDFEFSQGNYANAIRNYEQALKIDPHCGPVAEKLQEAKRKASN